MSLSDELTHLSLLEGPKEMIERIMGHDGVFYRSEQRGTPDIGDDEKRALLTDMYAKNPRQFMSRYASYLLPEDCSCFDGSDYEIAFYVRQIAQRCAPSTSAPKKDEKSLMTRNKRYAEMLRLKRDSDYFSNAKMREREPLMFDEMIGKFLPEEEQVFLRPTVENDSFSGLLMQFEDSQIISDRRKAHIERRKYDFENLSDDLKSREGKNAVDSFMMHVENRMFVAEEEEEEEEQNEMEEGSDGGSEMDEKENSLRPKTEKGATLVNGYCAREAKNDVKEEERSEKEESLEPSSEDERSETQLKDDFMDHMEQRFLRGDDNDFFDYATVDDRPYTHEFEKMRNQDIEDAYFDED